jgi:hypothetical protein
VTPTQLGPSALHRVDEGLPKTDVFGLVHGQWRGFGASGDKTLISSASSDVWTRSRGPRSYIQSGELTMDFAVQQDKLKGPRPKFTGLVLNGKYYI